MWVTTANGIQMTVGDYCIELPITIVGTTITSSDSVKMRFKDLDGSVVLEKEYSNIAQNTFNFELTEEETALFPVGVYSYSMDWYQNGNFMCNLIPIGLFKVVGKE